MRLLRSVLLLTLVFFTLNSFGTTYYWIGKSGLWNDALNWSLYSGGFGGAGIPGSGDDVVFDNHSFNSSRNAVKITSNVSVKNFTWNAPGYKPTLFSDGNIDFEIRGNYDISSRFKNKVTGRFVFNPSSASYIKTNGVHIYADIVKKSNKKLLVSDGIYLEGSSKIVLERGELNSNGKDLKAASIEFETSQQKKLVLDNSIVALDFDYDNNRPDVVYSETNTTKTFLQNRTVCGTLNIIATVTTNYNGQHVSCNDSSDATICVTIITGTGPYTFQWIGPGGPNTQCWVGVDAGTYLVVVQDLGTGTVCNTQVTVTEPPPITLFTWNGTNPTCNGVCDGTASPIIIGGTPGYNYSWSSGETTQTATQLCVGLNTLNVTDANGCPFDTTFFILTPTQMNANISLNMVSCNGFCDGVANSNPSGGNGAPYTWSWDGGPQGIVDSINGLCAGVHTLHLEDQLGCPLDTTFTITQPIPINIQLTQQVNLVCNGICSGQLTIVATNGTAPYTYQWFNATTGLPLPGQTSDNATGLCAGDYYVIVTDANGCPQQSATFTLTQPTAITSNPSAQDVSCFGVCDGVLSITAAGGTPGYTFNWINAATATSVGTGTPLGGMCPGTYFAEVTDANGCIVNSALVIINEPPPIQMTLNTLDANCFGDCNGAANVATSSGGTGPLTFTWFNSVPTQIGTGNAIANLCAGNYSATATDANGCTLNVPFTINEPNDYFIDLTTTPASCNGTCDGVATINLITGQGGTYTIDWSTSANTGMVESNLCAGSFTVTITDQNGCDTIHPFTITEPTTLTLSPAFADPNCLGSCDGMASANPSGGTAPYTFAWVDGGGNPLAQTTDTITGLCAGTYSVTVTDANGCTATANYTLTDPPGMTATVNTTTSTCGVCDGTATAVIVGGNPPYTVQWFDAISGNPAGTNNPQSNLCAGNYYAVVTDSTGCTVISDTAALTDNVIITGNVVPTNPTCFGFCNGSIDLTTAGGTPPLTYQWFDQTTGLPIGQSTEDAVGLCAGTYYVVVTDSNNCVSPPFSATLTEPTQLTANIAGQDATCANLCDGQATVTPAGGTPGYSYAWTDAGTGLPLGQTTATVTGLCAGTYNVVVTDAGGCTVGPLSVTINAPSAPTFTLVTTDALCFGDCNGTATASPSGGTPPYTFTWSSSANTTANETNLCAGSYTVSLTDANGCPDGPQNFTINEPAQLTASTVGDSVLCNGDCNGSISVTASGGTPAYSYLWSDSQTTPVASGLCAGNYTVTVTDANGCTVGPLSADVFEPTVVTFTTVSTDSDCNSNCNGTATANPVGGTPPYSYQWNDPLNQTTQTAVSLCAGTYTITVTDANGCSPAQQNVTINEPASLTVNITPTDASCNAACDGSASAAIAGGTLPYTILWDDPAAQTTANAVGLCAGNYSITVTDSNGCVATASTTINEPTALSATSSFTFSTCQLCDGTATVNPSGGTPGYTYQWDAAAGNQTTQTATALCAGSYNVTITDTNNCTFTIPVAVSDINGEVLTMDSTAASCNGACDGTATVTFTCSDPPCTISWNPGGASTNTITNLCAGFYTVTVTNNTGCISAEVVEVDEPAPVDPNANGTNVLCSGDCTGTGVSAPTGGDGNYTWQWDANAGNQTTSTAFNLCPGTYGVTVTDGNGCTGTDSATVSAPTALSANVIANDASCNGVCDGTGTAFPSGGTPPYSYQWDDPASQTTQQATGLCAGQYNVTVTDANGCTFGPVQITVNEPTPITVTMSNTSIDCNGDCDGTITASPSGGTAPYSYQWDDPFNQTTQTATNLCANTYTVIVSDVNGCQAAPQTVTLGEPAAITSTFVVTDVDCNGNCNGQIQSNVNGGTLPYNLQWNDPANSTTAVVSNLCAGNYTLNVTDAAGCQASFVQTVNQPAAIQLNLVTVAASCNGVCDGSITSNPSGGTSPYTFSWSPNGETTSAITGQCAGVYTLTVTDSNGCVATGGSTISEPSAISLSISFAGSSCGQCNGSATVSPSGGQPGYTYQWDAAANNQTTQTANNLCAGVYSVIVTDAGGCSDTVAAAVSDIGAEAVTVTITDESCFGTCDGTATANTACVNGPCTYQWYDGTGAPIAGATNPLLSGLCQGAYLVEVTNAANCVTVVPDTISQPTQIQSNPSVTGLDCNGDCNGQITLAPTGGAGVYTFLWNTGPTTATITNLCAGSYIVDITDSSGCTITDTIDITEPAALSLTTTQTNASCNGDCDGTATVNVSGGITPYTFQWDAAAGNQATQTAVTLCAGTYTVIVTDDSLCTASTSVTITEPNVLAANMASTDVTCNGDCNGTATVTPLGGTTPYTYLWDDPTVQTTQTASALCAGNYNVIVGDSNNCSVTLPVAINEPVAVTFNVISTDMQCNGTCNGTITINAAGGTGSYSYSINNGATFQASNSFTALCAGSYTVVVLDSLGCSGTPQNININEPSAITATTSFFPSDCNVANGAATVTPSGGTPGYSYVWYDASFNPIGQTTPTAIGLAAGIYNVDVTDANGCLAQFSVTVSNVNAPNIAGTVTDASCNGDCNGSIDVTTSAGTPPYTFLWIPDGQTSEDISNLCAGGYLLQVTDTAGCINFQNFTVNEPSSLAATFVSTDATCGQCDGTATVTPSGGTSPYIFDWSNGQTTAAATGLCSGAYMVQITDSLGCASTFNVSINNTGGPTGEVVNQTNVSCNGLCDGSASVTPVGGTPPYTYYWIHNGDTTNAVANLCAGTYFLEITDSLGCIRVTNITITGPQQFSDSTVVTPATCGLCDGQLSVFMSGGSAPYTFQWDAAAGGGTTSIASNLCEGVYSVQVTDANNCVDTIYNTISGNNAPQLVVTPTDNTCQGACDGQASVTINGGTPVFTTTWLDQAGNPIGQSGLNATNLCAGDYIVQVVDGANCTAFQQFSIDEPDSLLFSLPFVIDPTCFNTCDASATAIVIEGTLPYTFLWNDPAAQTTATATGLCAGTFVVDVTDGNGCTSSQTVIITPPSAITIALDSIDASCSTVNDGSIDATVGGGAGGYTYSWTGPNGFTDTTEDISNLFYGMYYLTVTDANGCQHTDSIMVNAVIIVIADAGNDTTICANTNIFTLNGNGGITYQWYDSTGTLIDTTQSVTVTVPGTTYYVLVAINGLCTDSDTIVITVNPLPQADAGVDQQIISGATTVIGGSPTTASGNSVLWNPPTFLNDSTLFNPTLSPDTTGNYTYVVQVTDPNGCINTDTVLVYVLPFITFPNGFSPNGDGTNDVWEIDYIWLFPDCQVEVYNRWGQLLFLSIGYQTPWDGTYNGQPVPVGTYYYIINLNHPLYPDAYTGPLTVLR